MNKKKIAVLFGGRSPEYAISLQSAYMVITHLDKTKIEPVLIGISRQGAWYLFHGDPARIPEDNWQDENCCTPMALLPDPTAHSVLVLGNDGVKTLALDAAFPVLHGKNGEDGTVQGALETAGVPVIGCGTLSSALCMDKYRAHMVAEAAGVPVPKAFVIDRHAGMVSLQMRAKTLGYPLFVKPVKAGSSFGVARVTHGKALALAVEQAFTYDDEVILEQAIEGCEVGCAVMGTDTLTFGAVDEIELSQGFFDTKEKYTLQTSAIHVPARISEARGAQVEQAARTVYRALGCTGFARVDFFLTPSGQLYFNEVNTIPGFTEHSRFPSMMRAKGLTIQNVVSQIIEQVVQA